MVRGGPPHCKMYMNTMLVKGLMDLLNSQAPHAWLHGLQHVMESMCGTQPRASVWQGREVLGAHSVVAKACTRPVSAANAPFSTSPCTAACARR